jgi:hypothetical protein
MAEPIGDLCVLANLAGENTWTVAVCGGGGKSRSLGTCVDRGKAYGFALAQANRLREAGQAVKVHFPDDCPCYVNIGPPPS